MPCLNQLQHIFLLENGSVTQKTNPTEEFSTMQSKMAIRDNKSKQCWTLPRSNWKWNWLKLATLLDSSMPLDPFWYHIRHGRHCWCTWEKLLLLTTCPPAWLVYTGNPKTAFPQFLSKIVKKGHRSWPCNFRSDINNFNLKTVLYTIRDPPMPWNMQTLPACKVH